MYSPTIWDFSTFLGTIGLFVTLFFLFVRVLPMIAIFEIRMLLPAATTKHGAAGDIGVDVEEDE
jgi:molybdopterin-containing oxidoreductase family membrane subunit